MERETIKVIVAVHGIKTGQYSWADKLRKELVDSELKDYIFIEVNWGYAPSYLILLPPYRWWKFRYVSKELTVIARDYPKSNLCVVSHSMGTFFSYHAIKKFKIPCKKLIMFSSILSVSEKIGEVLNSNLRWLLNYQSPKDIVAKTNPFGHSGAWGFTENHPRLIEKIFHVGHSEWWSNEPPNFYRKIIKDVEKNLEVAEKL